MINAFRQNLKPLAWLLLSLVLSACAHPINIGPIETPARNDAKLIKKNVAYVMTDENRNKLVKPMAAAATR